MSLEEKLLALVKEEQLVWLKGEKAVDFVVMELNVRRELGVVADKIRSMKIEGETICSACLDEIIGLLVSESKQMTVEEFRKRVKKTMKIELDEMRCGICGEKDQPATPLFNKMCRKCYRLWRDAEEPSLSMSGHPENATYYREKNYSAIKIWEDHLTKHGFVKKWGRWRKKE